MPDLESKLFFYQQDDGGGNGGSGGEGDGGDDSGGDDGGGAGDSWRDALPEDIRSAETFTKFAPDGKFDVGLLARSYLNAEQLIGRDKIPMPKTDSEWNETYTRLGRPEKSDGYQITLSLGENVPQGMKDGFERDLGWFKDVAHEAGLNQNQANKLFTSYADRLMSQHAGMEDAVSQEMTMAEATLKDAHGDAYKAKMTLANRAVTAIGGETLVRELERLGMGRSVPVISAFIKMGEQLAEEDGIDTSTLEPLASKEDLQNEIAAIEANPAYLDPDDTSHKFLIEKRRKLYEKLYPPEA